MVLPLYRMGVNFNTYSVVTTLETPSPDILKRGKFCFPTKEVKCSPQRRIIKTDSSRHSIGIVRFLHEWDFLVNRPLLCVDRGLLPLSNKVNSGGLVCR